jgi:hypothetical protein
MPLRYVSTGAHPACESPEVKHFDGFRVRPLGLGRFPLLRLETVHFPREGKSQVVFNVGVPAG